MHVLRWVCVLALLVWLSAGSAAGQVVRGTLREEGSGEPVAGAAVSLLNAAGRDRATTVTDASGSFTMRAPNQGVYWLRLTPTGHQSVESRPFAITRADTLDLPLTTRSQVTMLEGVTVRASTSQNRNFAGFLTREQNGFGRFLGPEQVQRQTFGVTGEFLVGLVPGLDYREPNVYFRNRGRYCAPMILLDGARFSGVMDEIPAAQVRAIEVYDQPALIPPELTLSPFNTCGAIAIWTFYGLGID
jgi:hypothetical protein